MMFRRLARHQGGEHKEEATGCVCVRVGRLAPRVCSPYTLIFPAGLLSFLPSARRAQFAHPLLEGYLVQTPHHVKHTISIFVHDCGGGGQRILSAC